MTRRGVRLLNVDDTEAARYTKSRPLRHAGFEVVEAVTGYEALQLMDSVRPSVVLLDVRLPDISGIEVCREIKRRWPESMVLQTSAAFTSAADRTRGLEGGADAYLVQPIDPQELVATVRALLRLHSAEAISRELNDSLEQRIEERTAELADANAQLLEEIAQRERAESALVQSQKMEAVGQLTGSMAHDFNNILAAMVGFVYVASRKNRDPEVRGLLEKALGAADRGRRLTTRLLAFARREELSTDRTDLREVLEGMADWLPQSAGSLVQCVIGAEAGDLLTITDANQLELAVLNLVINARDAMPDGGRVSVTAAPEVLSEPLDGLAAGAYAVIRVADNGPGMSPEVAEQAFRPFFTTKPKGQGTGLGLAQVAHVASLSGGGARIESVPGAGTTVEIWLPSASEAAGSGVDEKPMTSLSGRGERVLVVDDEPDITRTIADLLMDNGYSVVSADSGRRALEVATQSPPDVAVLDFAMHGMDGVELAHRLRQIRRDLPILFVSGNVEQDLVQKTIAGSRLLRKPFRPESLLRALRLSMDTSVD